MTISLPGPTLGVVGGGQLGRMLAEAAAPLGVDVVVLDPTPNCPASRVCEQIIGDFDDPEAVRKLAAMSDILTYEIELADPDLLASVDTPVQPHPDTLRLIGDKLHQNEAYADAGIPTPPFRRVDDEGDLAAAVEEFGQVMLKARSGGYDGRGNLPVGPDDDFAAALDEVGARDGGAMAEAFVEFERELAVVGVVGDGETAAFPVTETVHREEILRETVVPARTTGAVRERARTVASEVLDLLEGRGVYGIELFETPDGEILVNEVAPRPHNSGHWTIEGAVASQFEQHARAVLGWPLGSTARRGPTVTANLLGDVDSPRPARLRGVDRVLASDAHLHWYGKREARPLRKMGHLTLAGGPDDDAVSLIDRARDLRDGVTFRADGETGGETADASGDGTGGETGGDHA
ncbi:MAG: 5-(carboxyamino)imidazole ribonucleotide synthase [Haloferacaceae archaeon]